MADSLWIAKISFIDWEDDTLTMLVDHPWTALKGAADERQAYAEEAHSGTFDAEYTWPAFSSLKNLFNSSAALPKNGTIINNNLKPDNLGSSGNQVLTSVETSTIKADGTAIASASANYLTYAEILTGPLSYASSTFLHMTDTSNGVNTTLLRMAWVVQWYKYMSYTQYYAYQTRTTIFDLFSAVESRKMVLNVAYDYNSTTSTFTSASANYTNAPNSPVDLYVTNDLNESSPFSSEQDVWDYTVATFNGQTSGADWVTQGTSDQSIGAQTVMSIARDLGPDDVTAYDANITQTQVRIKVNESFRATSPAKFQAALYFYFYITQPPIGYDFNALGVGLSEDVSKFLEMTADGSGWYYLEPTTAPDFDLFSPPTRPSTTTTVIANGGYEAEALNNEGAGHVNDIFIETNDPAGTAFAYYNP